MTFIKPQELPPIATYRVFDMNAELQDPERQQPDVTNEQALQWYKNMLTGITYVSPFHIHTLT